LTLRSDSLRKEKRFYAKTFKAACFWKNIVRNLNTIGEKQL
jgi:hypothetical protein